MRTLSTYIEYLLMTRHYCFVPGKGAYMMSDESATLGTVPGIGSESRLVYDLTSPRRKVHFSALHYHDDGILAGLLMEAEGMTYDQACGYIQRQAQQLPEDFSDVASLHTDVDNFGFESLKLETWADMEKRLMTPEVPAAAVATGTETPRLEVNRDSVSIPKYWLQRAAVVLLIALFFFTDFIGLNRNNHQLASVLNISILKRTVMVHQDWEDSDMFALDEADEPASVEMSDIPTTIDNVQVDANEQNETKDISKGVSISDTPLETHNSVKQALATQASATQASATQPKPTAPTSASGPYYIIVASTRSEEEANRVCRRYLNQGYEATGILSRDGLFRVYLNAFAAQAEATSYLRDIRQVSERLSKAWMLTVKRDESLSYIIKNIYNDNQLSMELSHPNQRTERDKG